MARFKLPRRQKPPLLPNVIAAGLEALRIAGHFSSWEEVADEIKARELRHPEYDDPSIGKSADTWRNLVKNDGAKLHYAQLELLAGVTGVPAGAFLAVTGSVALLRNGATKVNEARRYAAGLRALAEKIEEGSIREHVLSEHEQALMMVDFFSAWRKEGYDCTMPLKAVSPEADA